MATVQAFVDKVNLWKWDQAKQFAYEHPNVARLLSIPFALSEVVEKLLKQPCQFVEEVCRIPQGKIHIINALKHAVKTVFSPLAALIFAITTFVRMLFRPAETCRTEYYDLTAKPQIELQAENHRKHMEEMMEKRRKEEAYDAAHPEEVKEREAKFQFRSECNKYSDLYSRDYNDYFSKDCIRNKLMAMEDKGSSEAKRTKMKVSFENGSLKAKLADEIKFKNEKFQEALPLFYAEMDPVYKHATKRINETKPQDLIKINDGSYFYVVDNSFRFNTEELNQLINIQDKLNTYRRDLINNSMSIVKLMQYNQPETDEMKATKIIQGWNYKDKFAKSCAFAAVLREMKQNPQETEFNPRAEVDAKHEIHKEACTEKDKALANHHDASEIENIKTKFKEFCDQLRDAPMENVNQMKFVYA